MQKMMYRHEIMLAANVMQVRHWIRSAVIYSSPKPLESWRMIPCCQSEVMPAPHKTTMSPLLKEPLAAHPPGVLQEASRYPSYFYGI